MIILPIIVIVLFLTGCPPGGQEGAGASPIAAIAPFILIFVLFYFLILRPQQKQGRERQEMLKNLKRGDNVITSGGIYGRVLNISGDVITLEVAKGVNIKVSRSGVSGIASADDEEKKEKEDKSDK